MRIAFSGSHRVGKTTLLEAVASALPGYATVDEPYNQLEEDGYEHSDPPALSDFEAQLERAIEAIADSESDVLFDRCPVDVLAYLLVHDDASELEAEEWVERARAALTDLDLVVFVPIEQPDRITLPAHESKRSRRRVHEQLEQILLDDSDELGCEVLVATGDLASRAALVVQRVRTQKV